ncbi:MAG TPA: YdcF family protein [Candidatus Sulfotelmatobacter sp.]|nr:YdcF family protein [Candidatus Sulfotelmatobacter sp.]
MDSPNGTDRPSHAPRLRLFLAIFCIITGLLTTTGLVVVFGIGKWLVREDPLQPATAIVVLSGGLPTRALEAAALYHEGYAKEIWLTRPDAHADPLKELGINYPSEADFNTRVLRRAGVPAKAIHVLDTPIVNTEEELDEVSAALKAKGGKDVIIVTNKSHTRRVHILWTKYYGSRGVAIVHGLPDDDYVANHWWRDPGSMTQVAHEVLGIINAWGGLPVKRTPAPTPAEVVADRSNAANAPEPQHAAAD